MINSKSIFASIAAVVIVFSAAAEQSHQDHKMDGEHHQHEGEAPAANTPVENASITANVNGMVCDFCARAVEKVFGREEAVDTVSVDLDTGAILIALKPGANLSDERVSKLVRDSGYALVSIDRKGTS